MYLGFSSTQSGFNNSIRSHGYDDSNVERVSAGAHLGGKGGG